MKDGTFSFGDLSRRKGSEMRRPKGPDPVRETRAAITRFLFLRDRPGAVDLCLVLGCPSVSSMDPAVELFHAGLTPWIVISGRGPEDLPESEFSLFVNYALERGVPAESMLQEMESTNTRENFINSSKLIEERIGWDQVCSAAIVGKPFHMRRALMTARRWWPPHLALILLPSLSAEDLQPDTWWKTARGRERIFAEIERIGHYALKGDLKGD